MVRIDEERCTGCGVCVSICHESCMFLIQHKIHIDYALCSTCAQCIAMCPQAALLWNDIPAQPYNDTKLPSSEQLDELFKQRRTIRHFTKRKPERGLLEEIIRYGAYAPTHNFCFRVIAVDDDKLLEYIDHTVLTYNTRIYRYLYKPRIVHTLIRLFFPAYEQEYMKAQPKLEESIHRGKAYQCLPPVILCIVGEKHLPLSTESAQYGLYTMDLYARTKGLGCRNLVGNQMFLNRNKALKARLNIANHERIYAMMGVGYPAKTFRNKVMGKSLPIEWNNEGAEEHGLV